jgi:hypothetical protein
MLTARQMAIALACCLALISDSAQSQRRPGQQPVGAQSAPTTQPAASDQRGTDQVPFTVKIIPGRDAEEKANKEEREHQEKAKIDEKLALETQRIADYTDRLALFTFFLFCVAVVQAGLFMWQLWIMRQSLDDTKKQIGLARDDFNSTHRPKIRIKHIWLQNDIWQGESIIVNLTCVNNGTTEAVLSEIGIKYFVVRSDRALPIEPRIPAIFNFAGQQLPCGRNWETRDIDTRRILTPEENANIQQGRSHLYCVGYVSYFDAAGRMRITGFCRVLKFPQDALAHIGNCRFRKF